MMPPIFPSPFWFISAETTPCSHCRGLGIVWATNAARPDECAPCLGTGARRRSTLPRVVGTAARYSAVVLALIGVLAVF